MNRGNSFYSSPSGAHKKHDTNDELWGETRFIIDLSPPPLPPTWGSTTVSLGTYLFTIPSLDAAISNNNYNKVFVGGGTREPTGDKDEESAWLVN